MNLRYALTITLATATICSSLHAQTYFKGLGTSNSTFLLGNVSARHTQCLYLPSDLNNAESGTIIDLYFRYGSTGNQAGVTLGDLSIRLGQTDATAFVNGNVYFDQLEVVLQADTFNIPPGVTGEWFNINLDVPYDFNATKTLILDITFLTSTTGTFGTLGTPNSGRKLYSANAGTPTGTTSSTTWQDMGFDLDIGTGVRNLGVRASSLYPNPFSDLVQLDLQGPLTPDAHIEVLDITGRTVMQLRAGGHHGPLVLDMGGYPAGAYIVRASGTQEQVYLGRVVKQ